jgi:hypothetical protein
MRLVFAEFERAMIVERVNADSTATRPRLSSHAMSGLGNSRPSRYGSE